MRPLEEADLLALLRRALEDPRGLPGTPYEEEALRVLAQAAGGDARFALNTLELAASFGRVDLKSVREALGAERFGMDREGDRFYDLVSALHKSLRGSHVDAALYYLARLLQGGADPRYLARRLIRVAVEDVGLADPWPSASPWPPRRPTRPWEARKGSSPWWRPRSTWPWPPRATASTPPGKRPRRRPRPTPRPRSP